MAWIPFAVQGGASIISALSARGGNEHSYKKMQNFDPQQQKIYDSILSVLQGGGYGDAFNLLKEYADPNSEHYNGVERGLRNEYEQQFIPQTAERFAGAGALSSSGFGQALGAGKANLESNIANMRLQGSQGALSNIFNQYQNALGYQPYSYIQNQRSNNPISSVFQGIAGAAGSYGAASMQK